jgi:hypothetical protein
VIDWFNKKKKIIVLSNTEYKYMALIKVITKANLIFHLLNNIEYPKKEPL